MQCVRDGLDATHVKCFYRQDGCVETVTFPDYRVRLLYAILALKLKGLDKAPDPLQEPVEVRIKWIAQDGTESSDISHKGP